MEDRYTLGIDIGGTNSKWGIISGSGEIIIQGSIKTNSTQAIESFVKEICSEINSKSDFEILNKISGIGIGAPNGNFHTGNIENPVNLAWKGILPVTKLFSQEFGLPAKLTNDANAAAIGEKVFGGAKNMEDFVVITLGTGLGSGIFASGKLLYGKTGMAGELGHITAQIGGRNCSCGKKGCLEEYVSAKGLISNFREEIEMLSSQEALLYSDIRPSKISELADNGFIPAQKALYETGKYLGIAIGDLYSIFSPEAIFLTGGISESTEPFMSTVIKFADMYSIPFHKNNIVILKSSLGNSTAGIIGAAALARDL